MKKIMKSGIIVMSLFLGILLTCCEDEPAGGKPPVISLDNQEASYSVKAGRQITIAPEYENVEDAVFAWKLDGNIISTEPSLVFSSAETGVYYIELCVANGCGTAYSEVQISVVELAVPQISLAVPQEGYVTIEGGTLLLEPVIENGEGATFAWYVNGVETASTRNFSFVAEEAGTYTLKLVASSEDGSSEAEFAVKVYTAEQMPFSWDFEYETFNVAAGRTIRIKAFDVKNDFGAEYIWKVDGTEVQRGTSTEYLYTAPSASETKSGSVTAVSVTMKNPYAEVTKELKVNNCPAEGEYKRTATGASNAKFNRVYEFLPAPGQFINEGYVAQTMDEATEYAESRLQSGNSYVSLGGFGGYIVVGFDHSIENDGDYNIQIKGNSFSGSSEPGIVWVMQDENGDGLPNDTWYELKGSEFGTGTEIRDYCITYYRPKGAQMPVLWEDNRGGSGYIDYLGSFHRQDYYYPEWVAEDSYTLRGTCISPKNEEIRPGYWFNGDFEWGYADNFGSDRLTDDDNYAAAANGNHFKIDDAVTFDGKPANLKYIDFVKVQCAVNAKSGWLGEISTEVLDFNDFNLLKNKK